ncbi:SDR family NAD(P)-dependent oxidoreductase [Streptomyces hoynatensis]|uniref:SDR family NAD(P)-dependent oxidoreductase n=1 Tax=Streptomyces hoynatensis TaxID=1141874 RepID=A0A3A9YU04_9ACTN|nr:SDR family NAD(P)-dependent oxidoreductase [Streptomyces hoynatensis]RKN39513.1 SDR family NAD(P)-dependent oxidoreductase [Streptomyces hoynatensis]
MADAHDPAEPATASAAPPKTIVLTGGTAGIGRQAVRQLAALGHRVILIGRDRERGERVEADLRRSVPEAGHALVLGDLATAKGIEEISGRVGELTDRVDVLVNCAGMMTPKLRLSEEGFELNVAVNHLAPFSLTSRLLPLLRNGAGRVVNVNSEVHRNAHGIDVSDLRGEGGYEPFRAYGKSKLANLLFSLELSSRYPELTVLALHPGVVRTSLGRSFPKAQVMLFMAIATSATKGARPVVRLAVEEGLPSGGYWDRFTPSQPSAAARDAAAAAWLWQVTEELRGPFEGTRAA